MRCKACNSKLKEHEIIWRADRHEFEELCLVCRNVVFSTNSETSLKEVPMDLINLFHIEDTYDD